MDGGLFRIEIAIITTTSPPDKDIIRERLQFFASDSTNVEHVHVDPIMCHVEIVATSQGGTPAEALQHLLAAMVHLTIAIRNEHGLDPLGKMPHLRELRMTHV